MSFSGSDVTFMNEALVLARKAYDENEVPVGAVVVMDGRIIGQGYNLREKNRSAIAHAEMIAIEDACKNLGAWRLSDATLYVTLEPCPMCAGALAWSQIGRLVYGASDPKRGYSLFSPSLMHPKTEVVKGVEAEECGNLVSEFFKKKRNQ